MEKLKTNQMHVITHDYMISFCFIITILVLFVSIKYNYDKNIENEQISQIGGPWIRSAKNVRFVKNTLCADLRTDQREIQNEGDLTFEGFRYNRACTSVYYPDSRFRNQNGYFWWMDYDSLLMSGSNYSHEITHPQGTWIDSAHRITYFPQSVCAFFLNPNNESMKHYVEDCIEYDMNDFLINENGKFAALGSAFHY